MGAALIHARHHEHPCLPLPCVCPCQASRASLLPLWHLPKQPLVQLRLAAGSFDPIAASLGAVPGALLEVPCRVGFSLEHQKELRSSQGGPEESELCRINEP